jgi:hypothetical protein
MMKISIVGAIAGCLVAATIATTAHADGWRTFHDRAGNRVRTQTTGDGRTVTQVHVRDPAKNGGLIRRSTQEIPAGQGPYTHIDDRHYAPRTFKPWIPGIKVRYQGAQPTHGPREIMTNTVGDPKLPYADGSGRVLIREKPMPKTALGRTASNVVAPIRNVFQVLTGR